MKRVQEFQLQFWGRPGLQQECIFNVISSRGGTLQVSERDLRNLFRTGLKNRRSSQGVQKPNALLLFKLMIYDHCINLIEMKSKGFTGKLKKTELKHSLSLMAAHNLLFVIRFFKLFSFPNIKLVFINMFYSLLLFPSLFFFI